MKFENAITDLKKREKGDGKEKLSNKECSF